MAVERAVEGLTGNQKTGHHQILFHILLPSAIWSVPRLRSRAPMPYASMHRLRSFKRWREWASNKENPIARPSPIGRAREDLVSASVGRTSSGTTRPNWDSHPKHFSFAIPRSRLS